MGVDTMLTDQRNSHKNPKDNRGFESIADIVIDIADRAVGGFDNLTDDSVTYPRMILKWYMSDDCPEPLNAEVYQKVMRENDERVFRAIWRRLYIHTTC